MSYLLYCLFRGPMQACLEAPAGVGGQRVFTVDGEGLGAALSQLPSPGLPRDTSELLAYERVVEFFYRNTTVIPVRYGGKVESRSEALDMLNRNQAAYGSLIRELEGLGEMGVQVLIDPLGDGMENEATPVRAESLPLPCDTGSDYLAAKRQRYMGLAQAGLEQRQLVEQICSSLSGFSVRHKVEPLLSGRGRLLSLYFLVARDSVESFRGAVRLYHASQSVKLLLSGPWPPYNFVDSLYK